MGCLCYCGTLFGQGPELDQAAFSPGPFLAVEQSHWSIFRNMAGMAAIESHRLVVGYHLPYQLSELRSMMIGAIFVSKPALGISIYQTGGEILQNQQLALSTATRFDKVSVGVRVKYWRTSISGLTPFSTAMLDVGLQFSLTDKLSAGSYITNITGSKAGTDHLLPIIMASGIRYQAAQKLLLLFEVAHRMGEFLELRLGFDYQLKNRFYARTGYTSSGRQFYFGFVFQTFKLELDYALTLSPWLGAVHQTGISYSWP
jgi:hypothetical protein